MQGVFYICSPVFVVVRLEFVISEVPAEILSSHAPQEARKLGGRSLNEKDEIKRGSCLQRPWMLRNLLTSLVALKVMGNLRGIQER